ncbi:MAG: hypothetical protein CRN43_17985 [Candidatus Nephrothrix sp. EaCA]|nr:MAG: hypothetical protein CRN43_17985 [Candidatus Nephrothrix sp. EaCA]
MKPGHSEECAPQMPYLLGFRVLLKSLLKYNAPLLSPTDKILITDSNANTKGASQNSLCLTPI